MPITEALADHASAHPGRTAFVCAGESPTYAELADAALAFAHRLGAFAGGGRALVPGYGPQHVVALSVHNSADFVRAYAGATASPLATAVLDPTWPERRAADALAQLRPAVLVTDSPHVARLAEARGCGAVLVTGPALDTEYEPLAGWTAPVPGPREATAASVLGNRHDDQLFLIGFTSGTTSAPKAFVRTRRSWRVSLPTSARLLRLEPGETTVAPGPLSHGLSLYGLTESLYAGGTFVSAPGFQPRACAETVAERGATRFIGVPTMLRSLATTAEPGTLKSLRTLVSSGARLDHAVLDTLAASCPDARVAEYYGASELSFVTLAETDLCAPLEPRTGAATPVGRPFPGVELSVRRPDGKEAAEGEPGTVHLRSPLVCAGYLRPTDGTGLRGDGAWFTVGDQGFLRDGTLHLLGREGDMIVSGGHNIHPAEVESALLEHPALTAAHVLGLPDPRLGSRPVAFVHRTEAAGLTAADLRAHLADRLPPHRLPRGFRTVADWPLTTSGKVDAKQILDRMEADDGSVRRLA
ncbi:acyl--CoA ligase [Nocardiopsis sp. HNM0947]|uniref:Acyl--CoA ligase n=1 Tax=Nocardiopsis coralli TaxID=2772213 RepID=A0ABR9P2N4_9ACTN|nr:class I adenylate-forming enzyme family protein [Nocardiopsis coralli]MBE2998062.1 acyl--CoA ligase [Nocardiopsis coralli]